MKLLKRHEVDDKKWNDCVGRSSVVLPYAYTWYLDAVAENWWALVEADYDVVMPLPWFSRLGLKCAYQPHYCQQLGVFGRNVSNQILQLFLNEAVKQFPYLYVQLNSTTAPVQSIFDLTERKNLLLELKEPYTVLQKKFSQNHKRSITKATRHSLSFVSSLSAEEFMDFYRQHVNRKKEDVSDKHFIHLQKLIQTLQKQEAVHFPAALLPDGTVVASILLINAPPRKIALINCASEEGKKHGAAHYLFSKVIEQASSGSYTLDFEGSSQPGVARFYEGFGATPETYYLLRTHLFKSISQRFFKKAPL